MKKIIFLIFFIPIISRADFCTDYANTFMLATFWKIDNVPKRVALERVDQLGVLYSDPKDKNKQFLEIVDNVYDSDSNHIKNKDDNIDSYMSTIVTGYATILATCLAEHPEIEVTN
nr:hypothetical protein [Acinetobacter sp. Marseille-Q1620]